jgi:signal transduction histidine kinase
MIAQRYGREFIPKTGVKEYASMTQVLQKEIARVNNIIHQFLKFARPPKLNVTELPAEQFLDHIGTLVRGQAEAKGVRFSWTCANPVQVHFDAEQMTQALLNLVQNAIDATQKGGKVSVRLGKQENDLVIDIADTGSGIPPEQLERIFDLYYSTKPDGTGMGLAITQQIVSQHQGTLRVESEKGRGSTFSVRIPQI